MARIQHSLVENTFKKVVSHEISKGVKSPHCICSSYSAYCPTMKIYEGKRGYNAQPVVSVNGIPLNPRFDIWPFNFDGFEWGCGGTGAVQLALAILTEHLNDGKRAVVHCERFSWVIIAKLPSEGWTLSSEDIQAALDELFIQMPTKRSTLSMVNHAGSS